MREADRDYLAEMLDHAEFAIHLLGVASTEAVTRDRKTFSALCHAVQTIGEGASHISAEARFSLSSFLGETLSP